MTITALALARKALITFGIIYREWQGPKSDIESIRAVLDAAQQEAEAWEVIKRWGNAGNFREVAWAPGFKPCRVELRERRSGLPRAFYGSRIEALVAAAAWCRAELAK